MFPRRKTKKLREQLDGPLYAMQRANGDWFAFEDHERLRMPVFSNSYLAMQARARNWGMLLFKPVIFDEGVLNELAPKDSDQGSYFWLADGSSTRLSQGHVVNRAQLALLLHAPTKQAPA